MIENILYGPMGQVLGRITERNDGALLLFAATGQILGIYVPSVNITYGSRGNVVGRGNLLGTLLC
jgi:hypothetical protein